MSATDDLFAQILKAELTTMEGIQHQNPDTGAGINDGVSYIDKYTNRLFGAPFQLMNSVDRRFEGVNEHVGNEYLRNFILNSPILHIKPGTPIYTGNADTNVISEAIASFIGGAGDIGFAESVLMDLMKTTIFSKGAKLQKRMFGFRSDYTRYINYVNYMCRSMAMFLNLTQSSKYPHGIFGDDGVLQEFSTMKWQNYRLLSNSTWRSNTENFATYFTSNGIANNVKGWIDKIGDLFGMGESPEDIVINELKNSDDDSSNSYKSIKDSVRNNVSSVMFMVEPTSFSESLTNTTANSMIESTLDAVNEGVGAEIAFMTNSNTDAGVIDNLTEFLGDTVSTAANFVGGLATPVTGGFFSNLVTGALGTIKGQKMIYPKIYKSSSSTMDYQFTVNLHSPYGDVYNYYMNIVVPLMHLIALAAPRMVSSNSVASPFVVQAFIPGMCTCQLGIISQMEIVKNPDSNRVSVNGYPLDITVKFTIEELYNAMSISPSDDPGSFLFNETLNDYMSNLAGLQPSANTQDLQKKFMLAQAETYFTKGEWYQDLVGTINEGFENWINPYKGSV